MGSIPTASTNATNSNRPPGPEQFQDLKGGFGLVPWPPDPNRQVLPDGSGASGATEVTTIVAGAGP